MKAVQLMLEVSRLYNEQRETFSKTEILKRINQIKYLSKQKGTSKFEIRKEIVKLENQMQQIFELEKKMVARKRQESVQVTGLKRQLTIAKKKLAASADTDLSKKVTRLSHILSDVLAKHGTAEDIGLSKKVINELHIKMPPVKIEKQSQLTTEEKTAQLEHIQNRLQLLRHELELKKSAEKNPQTIAMIEKQISMLDKKVQSYASQPHIATEISMNVTPPASERHTIKFDNPPVIEKKETIEPIDELPPPPQPKYR
jgi:hypothetical protein